MKSFCPHGEILFVLWVSEARLVALLVSRLLAAGAPENGHVDVEFAS